MLPVEGLAVIILGGSHDLGPYLPERTAYVRVTPRSYPQWRALKAPAISRTASAEMFTKMTTADSGYSTGTPSRFMESGCRRQTSQPQRSDMTQPIDDEEYERERYCDYHRHKSKMPDGLRALIVILLLVMLFCWILGWKRRHFFFGA
jgi:hypothetical protein